MKRVGILAVASVAATVLTFIPDGKAAAYKAVDVSGGGSIAGKLIFEGELPADAVEQIPITKNPDVCGTGNREVVWVDVKDGSLRGAFVFLDKVKEGKKWTPPEDGKYVINQKGCRFRPWAQIVQPGAVTIRNSDAGVLHNINAREMIGVEKGRPVKRTMFNFGQPDPGDIEEQLKPRRSHYVSINCEAHNFMFGFMMVPKHPYAVVVGEDGSYSLSDVPPGKYTLKAWHPRLGVQRAKITVSEGGAVAQDFSFSSK